MPVVAMEVGAVPAVSVPAAVRLPFALIVKIETVPAVPLTA